MGANFSKPDKILQKAFKRNPELEVQKVDNKIPCDNTNGNLMGISPKDKKLNVLQTTSYNSLSSSQKNIRQTEALLDCKPNMIENLEYSRIQIENNELQEISTDLYVESLMPKLENKFATVENFHHLHVNFGILIDVITELDDRISNIEAIDANRHTSDLHCTQAPVHSHAGIDTPSADDMIRQLRSQLTKRRPEKADAWKTTKNDGNEH